MSSWPNDLAPFFYQCQGSEQEVDELRRVWVVDVDLQLGQQVEGELELLPERVLKLFLKLH